jgi:cob(I)alamin adenosyltransferase
MSKHKNKPSPQELVTQAQVHNLGESMQEIKERVQRLESVILRGMILLVANLSAVIASLAQQLWRA